MFPRWWLTKGDKWQRVYSEGYALVYPSMTYTVPPTTMTKPCKFVTFWEWVPPSQIEQGAGDKVNTSLADPRGPCGLAKYDRELLVGTGNCHDNIGVFTGPEGD